MCKLNQPTWCHPNKWEGVFYLLHLVSKLEYEHLHFHRWEATHGVGRFAAQKALQKGCDRQTKDVWRLPEQTHPSPDDRWNIPTSRGDTFTFPIPCMVCIIWQSLRGILSHILAMMSAWVWFNKYTDNETFNWQLFIICQCVWFLEMPWSFDEGIRLLRLVWLMNKKYFDARLFIFGGSGTFNGARQWLCFFNICHFQPIFKSCKAVNLL